MDPNFQVRSGEAPPNSGAPLFSVVIPTFNRNAVVLRAVRSVLAQSFEDFELIVVDDGSSDDTQATLASIRDVRFKYVRQDNAGGSSARNAGIELASGRYIAFLDSDDEFTSHKLSRVAQAIGSVEADLYYSAALVDRGDGVTTVKPNRGLRAGEPVDEYLFCAGETISTITMVVESKLAKAVRFRPGLSKGQDLDFVVRLYRRGAVFHYIDVPLALWNDQTNEGRVSHANGATALEAWLRACGTNLSRKAFFGFRANVLSFELARRAPLKALWYVLTGWLLGGVGTKRACHSLVRAFLPGRIYRPSVDAFLRWRRRPTPLMPRR